MIQRITEMATEEKRTIVDITCNNCGESCMVELGNTAMKDFCGLSVDITGGYTSPAIGDGKNYRFDLCEKCLMNIITQLKIPAEVNDIPNVY